MNFAYARGMHVLVQAPGRGGRVARGGWVGVAAAYCRHHLVTLRSAHPLPRCVPDTDQLRTGAVAVRYAS